MRARKQGGVPNERVRLQHLIGDVINEYGGLTSISGTLATDAVSGTRMRP